MSKIQLDLALVNFIYLACQKLGGNIAKAEQSLTQLSLLFDFVANIPLFACWLNLIIPPEL